MSSRYPPQSRMPTLVPQRTETLWYPRQMGVEHMHDELLLEEAAYENSLREVRVSSSHYIPIGLSKPFLNDDDDEEDDEEEDEDDEEDLDRAHDLDADLSQDGYDPAEEAELDLDVDLDHDLDANSHDQHYHTNVVNIDNNSNDNNDNDDDNVSQDLNALGSSGGLDPYPDPSTFSSDMDHHDDNLFYSVPIEDLDMDRDLDGDVSEASSHGMELYSPQQQSPRYSP
ncbi:hypothetical protein EC968_005777 [Mortierella alpina]|nr:hypothetical protein EC968_005777 [Mortierella alpina]